MTSPIEPMDLLTQLEELQSAEQLSASEREILRSLRKSLRDYGYLPAELVSTPMRWYVSRNEFNKLGFRVSPYGCMTPNDAKVKFKTDLQIARSTVARKINSEMERLSEITQDIKQLSTLTIGGQQ